MKASANLTRTALDEFDDIVDSSLDYGVEVAERLYDRLIGIFHSVERGEGRGHRRTDLGLRPDMRLVYAKPFPFMVV